MEEQEYYPHISVCHMRQLSGAGAGGWRPSPPCIIITKTGTEEKAKQGFVLEGSG